jgi:hypothetical protein
VLPRCRIGRGHILDRELGTGHLVAPAVFEVPDRLQNQVIEDLRAGAMGG